MNQDESTYEVPDYILSRLQPTLRWLFPADRTKMAILQYQPAFAAEGCWRMTVEFWQHAHELKLGFFPRRWGINLLRYAMSGWRRQDASAGQDAAWRQAVENAPRPTPSTCEAAAQRRARTLGGDSVAVAWADFFFDPDVRCIPDREEDEEE